MHRFLMMVSSLTISYNEITSTIVIISKTSHDKKMYTPSIALHQKKQGDL